MRSENHFFYPEIIMICTYSITRAQNTHTHTHYWSSGSQGGKNNWNRRVLFPEVQSERKWL